VCMGLLSGHVTSGDSKTGPLYPSWLEGCATLAGAPRHGAATTLSRGLMLLRLLIRASILDLPAPGARG